MLFSRLWLLAHGVLVAEATIEYSASRVTYRIPAAAAAAVIGDNRDGTVPRSRRSEFETVLLSLQPLVELIENDPCKQQLLIFMDALRNSSLWAVQFVDASARLPDIPYSAETYQPGHFDECVDARDGALRGKYCLANVVHENSAGFCPVSRREFCRSAQEEGRGEDDEGLHRIGVCVPNECGAEDVAALLQRYYDTTFRKKDVDFHVTVSEDGCTTKDAAASESLQGKVLKRMILGLLLWVVVVTLLDASDVEWKRLSGFWSRVIEVFSSCRNIGKLSRVDRVETFGWADVHVLKVLTIFILVACQRYHMLLEQFPQRIFSARTIQLSTINNGPIFDVLIFLCGFSTVVALWQRPEPRCRMFLLRRYLRLIPTYALVIAFYAFAFESIGNGPFWREKIAVEARRCRDLWWTNLFFINNYMSAGSQCISQSWYLAVVTHCTIATVVFAHLARKRLYFSMATFGFVLCIAALVFVWNDIFLARKNLEPDRFSAFIASVYIRTHTRAPSYAIGALSAVLCIQIRRSKGDLTRVQIASMSLMFAMFGLVSVAGKSTANATDVDSRILHLVLKSAFWSLMVACLAIIVSLKDCRRVNETTRLRTAFLPLSRLSYPTLLLHNFIQLYIMGTMRTAQYVDVPRAVWMGLADVASSYALAAVLYIVVESPIRSLFDLILSKKSIVSKDPEETYPPDALSKAPKY